LEIARKGGKEVGGEGRVSDSIYPRFWDPVFVRPLRELKREGEGVGRVRVRRCVLKRSDKKAEPELSSTRWEGCHYRKDGLKREATEKK